MGRCCPSHVIIFIFILLLSLLKLILSPFPISHTPPLLLSCCEPQWAEGVGVTAPMGVAVPE